jgi:predicted HTH transcriptional regulator
MVIDEINKNPRITIPELSHLTSISSATISRYLKLLQQNQIIERVGSNKTGYWRVLK